MSDPYIYKQLNTKTLKSVTASDIQSLTDPTHIEFNNQFDFERYNLINKAVMRDGSPMPNTMKIVSTTVTDNTRTVAFTVNKGEVYQLMTIGATVTNPSGANTYEFFMGGTNTAGAQTVIKWYYLSTSNNTEPVFQSDEDFPDMAMYFDETTDLQIKVGGTFDNATISVAMIRVR
tara:strand:+ start:981 stop:1505 length:525 start_codon:yes stop_codon:yes gene_type:complete